MMRGNIQQFVQGTGLQMAVGARKRRASSGFSLVELLLTLVLILCLAAASVFSYTAMHRTANLEEGVNRLESLIRFARAEAATTGRKVQLQFPAARPVQQAGGEKEPLREIQVMWEPDFLGSPGVFQQYTNKSWSEGMVNELVGVAKVRSIQPTRPITPFETAVPEASADLPAESEFDSAETDDFPSITFYPDGSCDSAEIVLSSLNEEDQRMLEVRLSGILGSISSRLIARNEAGELPETLESGDQTPVENESSTQNDADEFEF